MRPVVLLLAGALLFVSCGADDPAGGAASPTTTASSPTSPPPSLSSSSLPVTSTTVTFATVDDPFDLVLELVSAHWSTLELWGDGWVELRSVVTGAPVVDRDSEVGALFPAEVFDAIEAAGATDVLGAFDAVSQAGLLSVVTDVLVAHPEAWNQIFTGESTVSIRSRTTVDGVEWDETNVQFLGSGQLRGSGSDGEHIALVFQARSSSVVQLVTSTDLSDWTVTDLEISPMFGGGEFALHRVGAAWYVLPSQDEGRHGAWVVDDTGTVRVASTPFGDAGFAVESTDAGLVAWGPETEGLSFSADGLDWQPRSLPFPEPVSGLAAVEGGLVVGRFVADADQPVFVGTADGREWVAADLPDEIDFPLWIQSEHHRGVVQRVSPPGLGRGGAIRPVVPHITIVEHAGMVFRFEFDRFDLVTTVTDAATERAIGSGRSTLDDSFGYSRLVYSDDEIVVLGDDGGVLGELPRDDYDDADRAAVTAALAALPAAQAALHDGRYVLVSLDGRAWDALVLDEDENGETPFILGVNGTRVLLGDGTDLWIHERDDR